MHVSINGIIFSDMIIVVMMIAHIHSFVYQSAIDEVMRYREVKSANPEVAEYQQLLRDTLSSVCKSFI